MNLLQRSVTSISWNGMASITRILVSFLRFVLLARMLPVEIFGVYALSVSIVKLTVMVTRYGMDGAFLHRARATRNEEEAAAVYFTVRLGLLMVWSLVMIAGTHLFAHGAMRTALLTLICAQSVSELVRAPRLVLSRRVRHQRLAVYEVLQTVASTVIALSLAGMGFTLWALLSTDMATAAVAVVIFYIWKPVWRPRLVWKPDIVRYYIRFGSQTFLAEVLSTMIDRVDDLWTGYYLGSTALGFYSRAYRLAGYPRQFFAQPITAVVGGVFAELKEHGQRLSEAFHYTMTVLVRGGFGLAGLLVILSYEIVHLLLGDKWLPMLTVFRLLLVFCMLDSIRNAMASLLIARGRPMELVKVRLLQLFLLSAGLCTLGRYQGLMGVALAVDLMLVAGIAVMLIIIGQDIQVWPRRIFGLPLVALIAAMAMVGILSSLPSPFTNTWTFILLKIVVYTIFYVGILYLGEGNELRKTLERYRTLKKE